jgi:DNA-binding LacI/PurR family transcriptional regulator
MLYTRYDQTRNEEMADTLLDGRVDGLIFLAPIKGNPMLHLVEGRIPFVVLSGEWIGAPVFTADNWSGTRQAIRHLHHLGHKRIAHVAGTPDMDDAVERREAYRQAMSGLNLPILEGYIVEGPMTRETGFPAATRLLGLRPKPTAVFCANDEVALGLIHACRELGVRVPDDLSVVGFDDAPLCAVVSPAVTTVKQPWEEMSRAATRALLALIGSGHHVSGHRFDTELVVRDSTGSPQEDQ